MPSRAAARRATAMLDQDKLCDEDARRATTAARTDDSQETRFQASVAPSRTALSVRQKTIAGIVGILSVLLIGCSAVFLYASPVDSSAPSSDPVSREQNAGLVGDAGSEGSARQSEGSGEGQGDAASPGETSEAPAAREPALAEGAGASAGGSDLSGSFKEEASGGGSSQSVVTVSVYVDSSVVGSPVSGGTTATFAQGATVYDALMACGFSVNASTSPFGMYVSAVGGLAEKEHGGGSGWKYSVNGEVLMMACDKYALNDGDAVSWFYVTG